MGTNFSKRGVGEHSVVMAGHHSGVMSGHEVMAYAFLSGTMCRPKRKRPMLLRSNSVEVKLDVRMLSRSPSPPTRTRKMPTFLKVIAGGGGVEGAQLRGAFRISWS